jgi:outer membrane receptor protein involved in Fe transport
VYQPVEGLRFRATQSRDIRAGNLNELFRAGTSTQPSVSDPFRNNEVTTTIASTAGNPLLDPEEADTTTVGFTYQPDWLNGLGLSVDWYHIKIDGAITSLPFQTIVDQCFEGNQSLCDLITRDPAGIIVFIEGKTQNAAFLETSGFDVEANYALPVWDGDLSLRLLASHSRERITTVTGSPPRDNGGEIGNPGWKATFTMDYERGPLSLYLRERFIGSMKINNTWGPADVDDNHVPAVFYTDLTGRLKLGSQEKWELVVSINNLFDKEAPRETGNWFIIGSRVQSGTGLYDLVGRAYTLGFRFNPGL